ncbi:hypothetical protein ANO14919_002050 [Xylariales sp. No.14919]|nr:hypothetical protein ANO14919_002050 [Xylariales sp. No.14919]
MKNNPRLHACKFPGLPEWLIEAALATKVMVIALDTRAEVRARANDRDGRGGFGQ